MVDLQGDRDAPYGLFQTLQLTKGRGNTMEINFDEMVPVQGDGLARRQGSRTSGPNPFLDKGWLQESYENGKDYQFGPVSGDQVEYTTQILQLDGSKIDGAVRSKYTGDLADVIGLIRAASNKLGIGAVVQVVPAANERGKAIKGQWFVKYVGKDRKAPRKPKDAAHKAQDAA